MILTDCGYRGRHGSYRWIYFPPFSFLEEFGMAAPLALLAHEEWVMRRDILLLLLPPPLLDADSRTFARL